MSKPGTDAGFSLIEVVAALGVFSIAAVSLMAVNAQSAVSAARLEARSLARIVADNQMARAFIDPRRLEVGVEEGDEVQMNRRFQWRREVTESGRENLLIITVDVRRPGDGQTLARAITLREAAR